MSQVYTHMKSQSFSSRNRYLNPYYIIVLHAVLIVSYELILGAQLSSIQLCTGLLQVYERVPSFSILEPIISPFKCLIMVLFQTGSLFVVYS